MAESKGPGEETFGNASETYTANRGRFATESGHREVASSNRKGGPKEIPFRPLDPPKKEAAHKKSSRRLTRKERVVAATTAASLLIPPAAVVANEITEGGVTRAVKEAVGFDRTGEIVAGTHSTFGLVDYRRSNDDFDVLVRTARMRPHTVTGTIYNLSQLEKEGYDLSKIENVRLVLGSSYEGPQGKFQQKKAARTSEMLRKYFGEELDHAENFWDSQFLWNKHYGYWIAGTVTNPQGQTLELNFTPNFAHPVNPAPQPST